MDITVTNEEACHWKCLLNVCLVCIPEYKLCATTRCIREGLSAVG